MNRLKLTLALCALVLASVSEAEVSSAIANPAIDMRGYLRISTAAAMHRDARRLSEADFLRITQRWT